MQENIWRPLGLTSTTFYPERYPQLVPRLANMSVRDESNGTLDRNAGNPLRAYMSAREGGVGGGFSTANDYIKFLSALCAPRGQCPLFEEEESR